jgi:hypothetical protein
MVLSNSGRNFENRTWPIFLAMVRRIPIACMLLTYSCANANPIVVGDFLLGLLGRGAVSRGVVSAGARSAASEAAIGSKMAMGTANRAAAAGVELTWLEREVAKAAIQRAFSSGYPGSPEISVASCLVIEYDGRGNYLANYCNSRVDIAGFAQHNVATGDVLRVGCSDCSIQPGELLYFAPLATVGPFVAAEYRIKGESGYIDKQAISNNQYTAQAQRVVPAQGGGIEAVTIRSSWNDREASAIIEVFNRSPVSVGLVVDTRSIWAHAQVSIFNECGGKYEQWNSPYDSFTGISKNGEAPTWIPPGGKILVSARPNTLVGKSCRLSYLTIDATVFRPGQAQGQPTPIVAVIN